MRNKLQIAVTFAAVLFLAGCALNRGELALQAPEVANPEQGAPVRIIEVVDKRVFAIAPPDPSTPSLKNDEIDDPAITKRAIARKRGGYGAALGDILLPEGETVEKLTASALASALKEKGYRVVSAGEPGYDEALPLSANINQFWGWFTPGFWTIKLEYRADVELTGDWPLTGDKRTVGGNSRYSGLAADTSAWRQLMNDGLSNLIQNLGSMLRPATST